MKYMVCLVPLNHQSYFIKEDNCIVRNEILCSHTLPVSLTHQILILSKLNLHGFTLVSVLTHLYQKSVRE